MLKDMRRIAAAVKRFPLVGNEKGIALVLVLSMLAVLTILGFMVLSGSDTELIIAGNFRTSQVAFQAGDRAVNFAMGSNFINDLDADDPPIDLRDFAVLIDTDPGQGGLQENTPGDPVPVNAVWNVGMSSELPGYLAGRFSTDWRAAYYVLRATGVTDAGRSPTNVETSFGRLFPGTDDRITRTNSDSLL